MPISTTCPKCQARFRLADNLAGKTVRCQKCSECFIVPAPAGDVPPTAIAASPPRPVEKPVEAILLEPPAPKGKGPPPLQPERDSRERAPARERPGRRRPRQPQSYGALVLLAMVPVTVFGMMATAGGLWFFHRLQHPPGAAAQQAVAIRPAPVPPVVQPGPPQGAVPEMKPQAQPGVINVVLAADGTYRHQTTIAPGDAGDPGRDNKPCKVYQVRLDAGVQYQIDMMSDPLDSFLRLADSNGNTLAMDDDGGGGFNSQIRYQPGVTGTYKIYATDLGGRFGPYVLTIRRTGAAAPVPVGKAGVPIEVALGADGFYRDNNALVQGDQMEPARNIPCKVYHLRLDAGQSYLIDMAGQLPFDAYLRLTDVNGVRLAEDDDGGGNLNARIRIQPPAAGLYKLYASELGGRFGAYTLTVRRERADDQKRAVPAPPPVNPPQPGAPVRKGNVTYRELRLPGGGLTPPVWDATGKVFFHLGVDGTLARLRADNVTVEKQVQLPGPGQALARCAEGLLVHHEGTVAISILDPETLQVKNKFTIPPASRMLTAAQASFALLQRASRFTYLDLKTGQQNPLTIQGQPPGTTLVRTAALTPNGRFLFTLGSKNQLNRIRVEAGQLIQDEVQSLPFMGLSGGLVVTPDSKYVCAFQTVGVGNGPTTFYPVERGQAALTLNEALRPLAVDSNGALYAQKIPGPIGLFAYAPLGPGAQAQDLSWDQGALQQLVPQPEGSAFLLMTADRRIFHGSRDAGAPR